jgi:hypothetical protein
MKHLVLRIAFGKRHRLTRVIVPFGCAVRRQQYTNALDTDNSRQARSTR